MNGPLIPVSTGSEAAVQLFVTGNEHAHSIAGQSRFAFRSEEYANVNVFPC